MKKLTLFAVLLFAPIYFYAQVGIGTTTPTYDLDVAGDLNLNKDIPAGTALRVNGIEALSFNGDYFSWGFGGNYNYFKDNVGIDTLDPQQALHVGGTNSTIRIDGLNAANHAENDGGTSAYVKVNADGDLTVERSPTFLLSINGFGPKVEIETTTGGGVSSVVYANNFMLDRPGIVLIKYTLRVSSVQMPDGSPVLDGATRVLASQLYLNGTQVSREAQFFSNDPPSGSSTAAGPIYLSGLVFVDLPAGTHNYELRGRVYGNAFGVEADFGGTSSTNRLQILRF